MTVSYWECDVHKCGSTNFNNLSRHAWDDCDIQKKEGKVISNTWHNTDIGGLNGDVSRKFYREWDRLCLKKQQMFQKKDSWKQQYEAHEMNAVRKY